MYPCNDVKTLVKAVVQHPDHVMVTELDGVPLTCEICVLESDYARVLKKLSAIKTLAARFSGLPEGQEIIIRVVGV